MKKQLEDDLFPNQKELYIKFFKLIKKYLKLSNSIYKMQ